jgi:hypothetical protein
MELKLSFLIQHSQIWIHYPHFYLPSKGKVVPLQAWCGPEGSRWFKLPDFHDI